MQTNNSYSEFSIVFAANANNPTILNPDFLKYNNIVPNDWELKQPPIITEPFAQVIFKSGISITSQLDKVVFSHKNIDNIDNASKAIKDIAGKYLSIIPHVNYSAIGINPQKLIKFESPDSVIKEKFFSYIFQNNEKQINIRFAIDLPGNVICNFNIFSESNNNAGIIVSANFHHALGNDIEKRIREMESIIVKYNNDIDRFNKMIENYFLEK